MTIPKVNDLEAKALWVRQTLWNMHMKAKRGHIASCFSCTDILVALYYGGFVRVRQEASQPKSLDDVLISKGHGIAALYPILADLGFFLAVELDKFTEKDGLLGMYADPGIPGISSVSDSLGHGLGIGCGLAFAARMDKDAEKRVFVILGDAELNEGSIWESAAFAGHYGLGNLVAIVDDNQFGVLGKTIGSGDIGGRFESLNWDVAHCQGHDFEQLIPTLSGAAAGRPSGKPVAIVAETVKGKGLSFMEGDPGWHVRIPDGELEIQGRRDLQLESA